MQTSVFDSKNKIWRGPVIPPLFNCDQSLGRLLLKVLQTTPDAISQISADTNKSVDCRQILERSIKMALYLQKLKLNTGDVVGFVASNTENLAPVVFACFTLGLPMNPLSPIMNENDIAQMYSRTKPKVIFCDGENLKVVQNAVVEMKLETKILTVMDKADGYDCVTDILRTIDKQEVDSFVIPEIDPNTTAMILCSSGSTGSPKGVCKSHKQFIHDFTPFFDQNLTTPIRAFQTSNIFWFSGIYFMVVGALFKCIRVITKNPIDAQLMVEVIQRHKINTCMIGPYIVAKILQIENLQPMDSLTDVMISGAVLSKDIIDKFKKFIPNGRVFNCYGSSEQNYIAMSKNCTKPESCGTPYINTEIRIVDEEMNPLGPNQHGEVLTRKPVQFSSYFGNPSSFAEAFHGDWFKSGDLGYCDENGCLFIVDRKKDLLKYENFQVTPSEIEAVVKEIEGVVNCSVVGVYDEHKGNDVIHAFVLVDAVKSLTEGFILQYANGRVSDPKKIRGGVHILDSLPLTFSGKINKLKLREIAKSFQQKNN